MTRSLVAAAKTAIALLGVKGVVIGVTFNTNALSLTNYPRDITVGTTTYTGVGAKGLDGRGIGESLLNEVSAATLHITSVGFAYHPKVFSDLLRGDTATLTILYWTGSAWASTGWSTTYTVDTDDAVTDAVTVRLVSADAAQGTAVPRRMTQEHGCQHNYKRGGCPYRGNIATCDKGYDTPNGCKVHFPDLTVGGETVPQPRPYGAFIGHMAHGLVIR